MSGPYTSVHEERERLILEHLPKVRWIAASMRERLPAVVTEDDLVSCGIVGLIGAIDNYDPGRNASLWSYAEYKVRGAMIDSVRALDRVSSHCRKRIRQLQQAISAAEQRLKRTAEEEEIAQELGIGLDEYRSWLLDARGITLGSFDALMQEGGESVGERYMVSPSAEDPLEVLERADLERQLAQAIESLPEAERMVLHLYYSEELTMVETGRVMNLHYSRISQLKSQAILRLRAYMQSRVHARASTSAVTNG
jgi:RNA polymerase sigma factor for flagellar operon FliA